jgi:hypothetical protein
MRWTESPFFAREELERSDALDSENSKVSVKEMHCMLPVLLSTAHICDKPRQFGGNSTRWAETCCPAIQQQLVSTFYLNSEVIAIPATERAGLSWQRLFPSMT